MKPSTHHTGGAWNAKLNAGCNVQRYIVLYVGERMPPQERPGNVCVKISFPWPDTVSEISYHCSKFFVFRHHCCNSTFIQ